MHTFDELRVLFEDKLKEQQFRNEPAGLYEPFTYILDLGGKRIRPVLMLMSCEMFGGELHKAVLPAVGIELFHNFTLIHDDIMDEADVRRGKTTVHKKFGDNTAILSGDVMMVYSSRYMSKVEPSILYKVINEFNITAVRVCEGQQYDMNFEERMDITIQDYLKMISLKTAALLAGTLKIGAWIGGADDENATRLHQFGTYLGIAFQLRDDWLDAFGDAEKFGKRSGGDILRNKKTALSIKAFELAEGDQLAELEKWYTVQGGDDEKVTAVKEIFVDLGVDQYILDRSREYSDKAFEALEALDISEEQRKPLLELAEGLLQREY